jgi:hypothetical protein
MTLTSGANVEVTFDSNPKNDRSESSIAANPTDPQNLVGASKKFTDPTTYQFSLAAVYSIDGGQTWSLGDNLQLPPLILDESVDGTSDPVVVFDDLGQAYLLGLAFHYQGAHVLADLVGMVVYQSGGPGQHAGQHWSEPTIIHIAPRDATTGNVLDDDKGAMASDLGQNSKNKGNVYVAWDGTDRNGNLGVLFARTTDHGQSWNGVSTDPPGTLIIPGAGFSAVTVDSNGRVYVFAGPESAPFGVVYVVSDDGGASFSKPQRAVTGFTAIGGSLPGGTFRVNTFAAACADATGGVLVAWADNRDSDARIYCRHSADGINWDGPEDGQPLLDSTIGSPPDHHDFHPQLALAPDGSIGCSFYEFGPTPTANLINTVLVRSTDNGHTFTERVTVTDKPWDPTVDAVTDENGATFIGDYFGLAANSLGFFPLWTDTRTGIQELFTVRVRGEQWGYFQGTANIFQAHGNKLWVVNVNDTSQQFWIGDQSLNSSPVVTEDGWVYYQGTDNRLQKIRPNGVGWAFLNNWCNSAPFVAADPTTGIQWAYYQGTDNRLQKVDTNGNNWAFLNNWSNSQPVVAADPTTGVQWVYFQGTDNRLLRVQADDGENTQWLNNWTNWIPCVATDPTNPGVQWVYFKGTDNRLLKVDTSGNTTQWLKNWTNSAAFVTADGWVYYQGTDNRLQKVDTNGENWAWLNNWSNSGPFVTADRWVYFQGTDNRLLRVDTDGQNLQQIGPNTTQATPFVSTAGPA